MPKSTRTVARWLMLPLLPLLLSGCPDELTEPMVDPVTGRPSPNAEATSPEAPPALAALSEFTSARWSDIAIAADGTMHVLFVDTPPGGKSTIYHRTSRDNGATWSAPQRLGTRDHAAGMPRIAIDGRGLVYAVWKDMSENGGNWMTAHEHDALRGGPYARMLMAAVLVEGAWSEPFAVSERPMAESWFLSVDPTGKPHVVWTEHITAPSGYQTQDPAMVLQASLSGATVEGRQTIYKGKADEPDSYDGSVWHYEKLHALRGYVDAAGKAHWVTTRTPSAGEGGDPMVVHWDGTRHTPLFKRDIYGVGNTYHNPPELVLDAAGREHVIVEDIVGERKGVLDFTVGQATPKAVRLAPDATGELQTFQLAQGGGGRLAAMISMKDRRDSKTEFELFVTRYENGQWTPAVDVTRNALRGVYKEFGEAGDGARTSSVFEPIFAAGAFDAQGRLNLAMVNMELIYTTFESTALDGGQVNQGAASSIPKVYFLRL